MAFVWGSNTLFLLPDDEFGITTLSYCTSGQASRLVGLEGGSGCCCGGSFGLTRYWRGVISKV